LIFDRSDEIEEPLITVSNKIDTSIVADEGSGIEMNEEVNYSHTLFI